MERLEAALEKARQERQNVQTADFTAPKPVKPQPAPAEAVVDPWSTLKTVKVSPRIARRNRITAMTQGRESAPYDLLRTRTLRIMNENGWKTLAVTSPNKTCGKTTVSANLAFSLARQEDLRVLVMDMDLRRPAMHKLLNQRPDNNLHEALAGEKLLEGAFLRVGENLAFGLNKAPAINPSELLQSSRTRTRLAEIQELFKPDITIFDMPPMLVSDENFGFLPGVDCGLLIGAADSTTISQLDICEKDLAELTNVLGVVLNKCRYADTNAGYDYDYY
jgi:Mrp family chromosome partitioning ATPase